MPSKRKSKSGYEITQTDSGYPQKVKGRKTPPSNDGDYRNLGGKHSKPPKDEPDLLQELESYLEEYDA